MDCPKCPGKLAKKEFQSKDKTLVIDQCFACKGVWFDKDELEALRELKLTEFDLESHINEFDIYKILNEKEGICPRCSTKMEKKEMNVLIKPGIFSKDSMKIKIDSCAACNGFWVDGGEINYLVDISHSDVHPLSLLSTLAAKYLFK